ncbi:MAG: Alcohol dehydrogenase zinc-binding domain protein [Mycobacterium sp.]|nr:Alcohol dehydrogenase zinc-binding domain protein [Mycobacterium sp.]
MHTGALPATMQAIVQRRYGEVPQDVLGVARLPIPTAGPREVLVRVRAAGVDRGTWHLMAGRPYLARAIGFGLRRPKTTVPGLTVAGIVEAVGVEISTLRPGDEVFGTGTGTFAEFAVARAERLVAKPANVSFVNAATVGDSGITALQAIRDVGKVRGGERVAIVGASGGVGSFAVQIAKAYGALVTGVASGAKLDLLRTLGADDVIDYRREDFTDGTHRFDVVVDIAGNRPLRRLRRALTRNGRLVVTGGENGGLLLGGTERNLAAHLLSPFVTQCLRAFLVRNRAEDVATVGALIAEGVITPALDRTFSLDEAAAAVRYLVDGRVRGELVIAL